MRRWSALAVAAAMAAGVLTFTAPAVAQSSGPDPAAVRELVGSIPHPQRNQCQISDPATEEGRLVAAEASSIRAMVRCYDVNHLENLWYILFNATEPMDRLYGEFVGTTDPATPYRDEDAQCPGETSWGFGDAKDDGKLDCYYSGKSLDGSVHDESVVLVWTYSTGKIFALAETQFGGGDASAIKNWWRDDAGPLSRAGRVKGFVDWTERDRDAEQALLTHVPKATRGSCVIQKRGPNGPFSGARFWASAVVACKSGTIAVSYAAMHPSVVQNFVDEFTPSNEGDPCPHSGTWSAGAGKKRHTVGNYACFTRSESDGTTTAQIVWSQREIGVVGSALLPRGNSDFDKLFKWWEGDSGPV